jgi:hypothetical protein
MERIIAKINSKYAPQWVPIETEDFSEFDSCFFNVGEKVIKDMGEIIYGWKLHRSSIIIEAERHSVWKSPEGELVDLTPDRSGSNKSLFVQEDKGWVYNGKSDDNIRINITNSILVDDYILLCETIVKLYQTGKRESELKIMINESVLNAIRFLEKDKIHRGEFISSKNNSESPCYCSSSEKYKDCHGYMLKEGYEEIINALNVEII